MSNTVDQMIAMFNRLQQSLIDRSKRNCITTSPSSEFAITGKSPVKLPCPTVKHKVGSELTIQAGEVRIGAGVTSVKASANILVVGAQVVDPIYVFIRKNTNIDVGISLVSVATTGWNTINVAPTLFSVNEGDLISVWIKNELAGRGKVSANSTFTVETL